MADEHLYILVRTLPVPEQTRHGGEGPLTAVTSSGVTRQAQECAGVPAVQASRRRRRAAARPAVARGWRWDAEMTEMTASMAAAGLPDGFHLAAAEIFRRSPRLDPAAAADAAPGDIVARVLAALTGPAGPGQ